MMEKKILSKYRDYVLLLITHWADAQQVRGVWNENG